MCFACVVFAVYFLFCVLCFGGVPCFVCGSLCVCLWVCVVFLCLFCVCVHVFVCPVFCFVF